MIYLDKKNAQQNSAIFPHDTEKFLFQKSWDLQTYLCYSLRDYFKRSRFLIFQGETHYFTGRIRLTL